MPLLLTITLIAAGFTGLGIARRKVRDITLTATWWWCAIAFVTTAVDMLLNETLPSGPIVANAATASALRYAIRTLLLCPTISVIGAKRPQSGPWNFIVLSLWAVLALPAAEAIFLNAGQPLEIHGARSWFIVVLIFVTLVNHLPTRHLLAAICVVAGQGLLLSEYFPWSENASSLWLGLIGLMALTVAILLFALRPARTAPATSLDRLWLDFRDLYGLFWTLRVQERLFDAAQRSQWSVRPYWGGWLKLDGTPLTEELPEVEQKGMMVEYRALLRRFVGNEWVRERTNDEGG